MAGTQIGWREPRDTRGSRFRMSAALAAAAALAAVPLLVPAAPAWAHAFLIGTTPADGGTATRVVEIVLDFDEELIDFGPDVDPSSVLVTDADGLHYETGCAETVGPQITAPVALGEAGEYTATWRSVTIEGHVIGGDIEFTYEPAAFEAAAAGSVEPRCEASASVGSAGGAAGTIGVVALGASALIAVGVASTLVVSRSRPPRPPRRPGRHAAPAPPGSRRSGRAEAAPAHDKLERS
ncbi:copper resistance CopC family protein [Agromyces mangrovi Wang et al. 2018]|uniref:copper resistance CopC family protein n=1 Tax=Agromyces mangrovi TaxID=1858653 RepID=UPI0025748969|nr:copper resistance CopC family protein [Agromyces mangrovi]BDZ64489.1 hypothetical protein GCM10025877_14270 [Agromyces mangrovi]